MSVSNGHPPGRPAYRNSKNSAPEAGDELGTYTRLQLIHMDEKFRKRILRAVARGKEHLPHMPKSAAAADNGNREPVGRPPMRFSGLPLIR
jgi:hypothetical protein